MLSYLSVIVSKIMMISAAIVASDSELMIGGGDSCQGDSGGPLVRLVNHFLFKGFFWEINDHLWLKSLATSRKDLWDCLRVFKELTNYC